MLLIFNPENASIKENSKFPAHGPINAPASIHVALEIREMITATPKICSYIMVLISKRDGLGQRK